MKRAAGDAIGAAARAEFEARGLDPENPGSFAKLPPDARRKIAAKGAVAAMVNGASTVAARQIVTALLGAKQSDLAGTVIEEGLSTLIEEGSQMVKD